MFCTCSRSFSISALMSRANPLIASASLSTPAVFDSSVFASRCVSCTSKSSFFPTSSWQPQQAHELYVSRGSCLLPQFFRRSQIRLKQFAVYLKRRGRRRFHVKVHLHVSAMNPLPQYLAQPQIVQIKPFRHAQLQIEKPVIDALHAHSQRPAVPLDARLRESRHGEAFRLLQSRRITGGFLCRFWPSHVHVASACERRFGDAAWAGASISSSANCKSCSRAYVPPFASSSACGPLSRICPSSSTRIWYARRIVPNLCAITNVVRPTIRLLSARCTYISDSESSSEVASSSINIGESFKIARAMAILCLCPPLNRCPRSPSSV